MVAPRLLLPVLLALALARPAAAAAQDPAPADTAAQWDDRLAADEVEVDRLPELVHPEALPRLVGQAYPPAMRRQEVEGSVTLAMIIEPGGHIRRGSLRVLSASRQEFVAPARWVALRLPFRAAVLGEREVAAPARLVVGFVLTDR